MAEKPGEPPPGTPPGDGGVDPSMEDILASIRRILNEDEKAATPAPQGFPVPVAVVPLPEPEPPPPPALPMTLPAAPPVAPPPDDDVVVLDPSMMVSIPASIPAPMPIPEPAPSPPSLPSAEALDSLIAPAAAAAAASSVGALVRTLAAGRGTAVHRGGPTIEDLVREEIRPLLKEWLDAHLPSLVERAVQAEIERVIGRSYS